MSHGTQVLLKLVAHKALPASTGALISETCLSRMCAVTHSYVCHEFMHTRRCLLPPVCWYLSHDSSISVPWLFYILSVTYSYIYHDSFIRELRLINTCAVTHSYTRHDPFICATWLDHTCVMHHSHVCHDPFICMPRLIHMCAMTHSYMCHEFMHMWGLPAQLRTLSYTTHVKFDFVWFHFCRAPSIWRLQHAGAPSATAAVAQRLGAISWCACCCNRCNGRR